MGKFLSVMTRKKCRIKKNARAAVCMCLSAGMLLSQAVLGETPVLYAAEESEYNFVSFQDDFSDAAASAGKWTIYENGATSASGTPLNIQSGQLQMGSGCLYNMKDKQFDNAVYEMDIALNGDEWVGFMFNREKPYDRWADSGCLILMNNQGQISALGTTDAGGATTGETISDYQIGSSVHLKIFYEDKKVKVYAGKTEVLSAETEFTSGYAGAYLCGINNAQATLNNVTVKTVPKVYENQIESYFDELSSHKILRDDVKARFPELPDGHEMKINSSSNSSVIATDGTVNPPATDTEVKLNITVSCINPAAAETRDVIYSVPRKTTADDTAFMQNLEYGVFLHYIWNGANDSVTTMNEDGNIPKDIHEFVNNFDVDQVVEDCEEFGVQYVIFTAWHAGMNPLYYSEVYRNWRSTPSNNPDKSDRDIIMELAEKLDEKGIDLLLYTHPNILHGISEAEEVFDYDFQGDTSFNYEKWNDYLEELYTEVTTRYKGKIKGFFIDEGLGWPTNAAFVDYDRLRAVIKDIDPQMAMIQNWSEVSGAGAYKCDTGMVEDRIQTSWGAGDWGDSLKTSITDGDSWPSFGLSFAARVGERPFNWAAFYDKNGIFRNVDNGTYIDENGNTCSFKDKPITLAAPEDIFRYTIYQAASNYGGMGSCWAFGPYSGSDNASMWEPGVEDTFETVGEMLEPIEESVFATKPSTSWPAAVDVDESNPRVKKGCLGEKTYVAMSSSDGSREFIHVLNPDLAGGAVEGSTLTLPAPADGKEYKGARLVDGGAKLELQKQADGSLTVILPAGMQWGEYDTAIELTTKEILPADKTELKEAIERAEQVETEKYTEETVEKFLAELEAAKLVLNDDTLTEDDQAIVEEALNDLQKAQEALVLKDTDDGKEPSEPEDPDRPGDPDTSGNPDGDGQPSDTGNGNTADQNEDSKGESTVQTEGDVPSTGDAAGGLYAAAALAAASAGAVITFSRKRIKK